MKQLTSNWKVTPTNVPYEIRQLHEDLWTVSGDLKVQHLNLGCRMTVIRLSNGSLLLHSPVRITAQIREFLKSLGEVKFVLAPNSLHHLFAKDYVREHQAEFWTVPDVLPKQPDIAGGKVICSSHENPWPEDLDLEFVQGARVQEIVLYHRSSSTLLLTDLAFNLIAPLGFKSLYRILGLTPFGPSLLERYYFFKKGEAVRKSIQAISKWDFKTIVVSHGKIVESEAKNVFLSAFRSYLRLPQNLDVDKTS